MRSEKFPYEGHILFEGHAADQVAGVLKIHDPDMWLLGGHLAKRWLCAWCRKGPGMFHDEDWLSKLDASAAIAHAGLMPR